MNDLPSRDEELFTKAIGLPAGQRTDFLEQACGGDELLRKRVRALLAAHGRAANFLEQSAHSVATRTGAEILVGEKPGDRIGHYKLLQQIGEGGGGIVFMAEQEEPIRRKVALKIIKPGMDTKSVIARFEAERRALTLMDHRNIAKVFDAGATASGRPYFVMELIRGIKITEYCDKNSLTTEQRLGLFVQVCQAIQHAHQKGIIHRDIKPANVLVTEPVDGQPLPVVIDFGIAKATTDQRLTEATLFTAFEMVVGTPAYMSPEQASLTSLEVDTRTDIYSLGVMLYELLTGSTPFKTSELLKSGIDEIRRVIREQEPVRPSARLGALVPTELATVAKHHKTEPGPAHSRRTWGPRLDCDEGAGERSNAPLRDCQWPGTRCQTVPERRDSFGASPEPALQVAKDGPAQQAGVCRRRDRHHTARCQLDCGFGVPRPGKADPPRSRQ